MNNAPELLPCPFCGGHAVRVARFESSHIECTNRNGICPVNMRTHKHQSFAPAVAEWNTRTDTIPALLAADREKVLREAAEIAFEADDCYLARNAILALIDSETKTNPPI